MLRTSRRIVSELILQTSRRVVPVRMRRTSLRIVRIDAAAVASNCHKIDAADVAAKSCNQSHVTGAADIDLCQKWCELLPRKYGILSTTLIKVEKI